MTDNATEENDLSIQQDSKNLSIILWIGTIFFYLVPGVIFYLVKTKDIFIAQHAKEAINWSATLFIIFIALFLMLSVFIGIGIGFIAVPILSILHLIFCVVGAIQAFRGKEASIPLAIRFMK